MRYFLFYLILIGMLLSPCFQSYALNTPLGDFPDWGESLEQVIEKRNIESPIVEEGRSLLFDIPAKIMLAKETSKEWTYTALYYFRQNKLIEFSISIGEGKSLDHLYRTIKNIFGIIYEKYDGPYFVGEETFMDKERNTIILLMNGDKVILYFIDFTAYIQHRETR